MENLVVAWILSEYMCILV